MSDNRTSATAHPLPALVRHLWHERSLQSIAGGQVFVALFLFLLVGILLSIQSDAFLRSRNLANLSRSFSWLAIAAIGQGMVIIIGGIDLSVGATMALAGLVAGRSMQLGLPVAPAILLGLLVGAAAGWLNGVLVARFRLPTFVVTLGTMGIQRGLAFGITGGWSVTNMPAGFLRVGQSDLVFGPWSVPVPLFITLMLAISLNLFLRRTVMGGDIYAMSSGERALLMSGVSVKRLKVFVYTLCGLLAATGGLLMAARLGVAAPAAAVGYEVDVVAAAVIGGASLFGGVGSILGVLLGAAITQMLNNGLILLGYPSYLQTATICTLMLVTILLDYWRLRRQAAAHGTPS